MVQELIDKISSQQGEENTAVYMVGEQLKDICRNSPKAAELVLKDLDVEEMSITNCEKEIHKYADELRKTTKGNCVCVSPAQAEKIIREFYGIPEDDGKENKVSDFGSIIDLSDFL